MRHPIAPLCKISGDLQFNPTKKKKKKNIKPNHSYLHLDSFKTKTGIWINYRCKPTSMRSKASAFYTRVKNKLSRWWNSETADFQTGSIPREEKDVEKPRPIPLCVCVCERAISYCTSRLRNISSCCCSVFMPSSLRSPVDGSSSAYRWTKSTVYVQSSALKTKWRLQRCNLVRIVEEDPVSGLRMKWENPLVLRSRFVTRLQACGGEYKLWPLHFSVPGCTYRPQ